MKIFRIVSLILITASVVITGAMSASDASNSNDTYPLPNNRVTFGDGCIGEADYPHPSKHKKGSFNVEARTSCSGKVVTLSIVVLRHAWGNLFHTVAYTKAPLSAFNEIKGNLGVDCKWKAKEPLTQYLFVITHGDNTKRFAVTGGKIFIPC